MCDWISIQSDGQQLADFFRIERMDAPLPVHKQLYPTHEIPVIVGGTGPRRLDLYAWGIFPFWAKDSVHARSESIRDHHAYSRIYHKQRCIIPCEGFGYRIPAGRKKEKLVRISVNGRRMFGLAGLYDVWLSPGGYEYRTCTVMTVPSAEPLARYHARTPVILDEDGMDLWMQARPRDEDLLAGLFKPFGERELQIEA